MLLALLVLIVIVPSIWGQELKKEEAQIKRAEVFNLGQIVVTEKEEAVSVATTVSEITAEEMEEMGIQFVHEALDLLPGVDVQVGGKAETHVSIRGFEQEDLKVLIDGVPVHETYYRDLDLSFLQIDAISKISVTKGASSVLYGSNTMGGVVNIITKKGGKEPIADFMATFGDYGTRNYSVNHGWQVGPFNYWFTYSYRGTDGFRLSNNNFDPASSVWQTLGLQEDGGARDASDFIKRGINAKVGYEPNEDTEVFLSFDYHNVERGVPTENQRCWRFSQWDQWHLNLVGRQKITDILTVKARGFYVDHVDNLIDDITCTAALGGRTWFDESKYDDYSAGSELQAFLDFGRFSYVKLGYTFIRDSNRQFENNTYDRMGNIEWPGWHKTQHYVSDTFSWEFEDEVKPIDKLSLVFGISYDYFNVKSGREWEDPANPDVVTTHRTMDTGAWNPQGGIVFRPLDTTTLYASVGKKTRFPNLFELYGRYGNADIKEQKTTAFEFGVEQSIGEFLVGRATYFYNWVTDLIDIRDIEGVSMNVNIGKAKMYGVEMGVDTQVTPSFLITTHYTYLSAVDRDARLPMRFRPRHKWFWDLRYHVHGLTADLQGSYTIRQFDVMEQGGVTTTMPTPDFFLLNATLNYRLPVEELPIKTFGIAPELFLNMTNITDRDYYEGNLMPGRNFLAGIRLRY